MTKKWVVHGRIRADLNFSETVEAHTEKAAVKRVEGMVQMRCGVTEMDIVDKEIHCEKIKDWGVNNA